MPSPVVQPVVPQTVAQPAVIYAASPMTAVQPAHPQIHPQSVISQSNQPVRVAQQSNFQQQGAQQNIIMQ